MPNVTMTLDAGVLKKVRRIALDRNTTLTAMVRDYLETVARRDDAETDKVIAELKRRFNSSGVEVGRRRWTREDLHDR